jgi:predicted negative regulator of RcsB-dependent stress response
MAHLRFAVSVGIALLGFAAEVAAQNGRAVSRLTYEVSTDQRTVLPLEPLFLTFSVANRTTSVLRNRLNVSLTGTTISVRRPGGQTLESDQLSYVIGDFERIEHPMAPGDVETIHERLEVNLDRFFPSPGTYHVRFKTADDSGTTYWSNDLVLRVLKPTGVDRAAYEYLRQFRDSGAWFGNANKAELEYFLAHFPNSGYADLARLALGSYAFGERNYERSTQLFAAVADKKGSRLSEYACRQLEITKENLRPAVPATDLAYEVSNEPRYLLPLEPVFFRFSVANRTATPRRDRLDWSLDRARMWVRGAGKRMESNDLSSPTADARIVDRVIAPGDVWMSHHRLMANLDTFFPTSGNYELKFEVFDAPSGTSRGSRFLVVRLQEPAGVDRAAYEYLRLSPKAGSWFQEAQPAELEDFLARFPGSGYAELARLELGIQAHAERDYQRAMELFTAVAGTGRSWLSEYATKRLEMTNEAISGSVGR